MTTSELAEPSRETLVVEREFADRRLASLARAIREHEGTDTRPIRGSRAHDRHLYRRLREISGERLER